VSDRFGVPSHRFGHRQLFVITTQAPVELLIRSFGGRSPQPERPCIVVEGSGQFASTPKSSPKALEGMPDGEQRVLAVVDALTVGVNSVDLAGALTGLDLDHSALALAALL